MKNTLESFPEYDPHTMTDLQYWEKVQAWVIGCKQELREIRKSNKNLCLDAGHDLVPDIVKEILGVEPKAKEEK
jgi:hypothetical protein